VPEKWPHELHSNKGLGGAPAYNCGFVSREQCMTYVSGIGGICEPNTQYVPSAPSQKR
jgi:hypothetical protein